MFVSSWLDEVSSNLTGNSPTNSDFTSDDDFVLFSSPSILVSSFLSGLWEVGEEGRGDDGSLISCWVGGVLDFVCNSHSKNILSLFLISS